jgi:sterol desaturase/sphingolipid hydroxylase (fatty acid hydroxylase superfamily)
MKERLMHFRSFWIFPILALVMVYLTWRAEPGRLIGELLGLIPLGLFIWTFLEYGFHRFAFHLPGSDSAAGRMLSASHLGHHQSPRDMNRLFVNCRVSIVISTLIWIALWAAFGSAYRASGILAGIWLGFLYYESVHYRVHLTASHSGLIARQRRAHFHHHFTNSAKCFGVTTPFWDHVFGTWRDKDTHKISR